MDLTIENVKHRHVICLKFGDQFFTYLTMLGLEWKQERFISQMEWAPFKSLPWNTNDAIANLTISFISSVSLRDRPCY